MSTTSFNPSYAKSKSKQGSRASLTPALRAWKNSLHAMQLLSDGDVVFSNDSSSNLGARSRWRRRGKAPTEALRQSLPNVEEQEHDENEELTKRPDFPLARCELDRTQQTAIYPSPVSVPPISLPGRMGHHVAAWLNQQQDLEPMVPPALEALEAAQAAEVPDEGFPDSSPVLASRLPTLFRAIEDAKQSWIQAADQWKLNTLSVTEAAIAAVTSLSHRISVGRAISDTHLCTADVRRSLSQGVELMLLLAGGGIADSQHTRNAAFDCLVFETLLQASQDVFLSLSTVTVRGNSEGR
ncbi:hypothetical protein CORC01_00078 [Colletotrichum orchidophilum]|uniref:Uncharacterized protein n=1 Tax=Colletotrichum orchidophilum TaxID=1209926 RepID=A0A1G4BTN0_9PEZI|nr:uncharacterized protein CORC01_00078 [Colletotrichum orchidophilum]OHF04607.1 hypothetical protein CORC01_00078 [Colletotrichum orchidophilum]